MPKITNRPPTVIPENDSTANEVSSEKSTASQSPTPRPGDTLEKSPMAKATSEGVQNSPLAGVAIPERPSSVTVSNAEKPMAIPEMQLGLRDQFPNCDPPDSAALKEGWKAYQQSHSSNDPVTSRLKGNYRQLIGLYSNLANNSRSLTSKVARLEHMYETGTYFTSSRAQGELRTIGRETTQYQQDLREFNQDVKQFLEQLGSNRSTPHRNTLRGKVADELKNLPTFEPFDTSFNQAYSSFVEAYGEEVAAKHNLPNVVESLRGNTEIVQSNGDNLEEQRSQLLDRLAQTSSTNGLKQIKKHIDYLKPHFESHVQQRENFAGEIQDFINFVDGLRADKDKAKLDREKTEVRKTELLGELQGYLDLAVGSNEFKNLYSEMRDEVGSQALAEAGLDQNYEAILHNFTQVQGSLQNMKSYAKMLHDDIGKADRMSWLEQRDSSMTELRSQVEQYKSNLNQVNDQIDGFKGQLEKLGNQSQQAPIEEQLRSAQRRFDHCPRSLKIDDLVARTYGNVIKAFQGDPRQASWESEFNELRSNLHSLHDDDVVIARERTRIEGMLQNASSPEDISKLKEEISQYDELVKSHNCSIRSYQRHSGQFLQRLPGMQNAQGLREAHRTELGKSGKVLFDHIKDRPSPLFDALNISQMNYSDGRVISFTAEDRIAVWNQLLAKRSDLSINEVDGSGRGLVHKIILGASMEPTEKASMIDAYADFGGDLNLEDSKGLPPLDISLRLEELEPIVISTLQQRGARLSAQERIPLTAHLLGAGGSMKISTSSGPKEISLEGLSSTYAAFGLDPVFIDTISAMESTANGGMKTALVHAEDAWRDTRSYDSFIGHMKKAQSGRDVSTSGPEMLMTGWDEPSGHAVGFVFNQEKDGNFLYACNAGDAKDPRRSIVKYEVKDFDKMIRFFRGCSHNNNETRAFFVGKPSQWGLRRSPESQQLPESIDRSSQKRGNCPIASRKTCLLAMLWSSSRAEGVKPKVVKQHYKAVTTGLREHGVRQAIEEGNLRLMGKALAKMLTKFDRPYCQSLAYELGDAILRKKKTGSSKRPDDAPLQIPDVDSKEFATTLRSALDLSHEWPLQERGPHGRTPLEYAKHKEKPEVVDILNRLAA